MNKNKTGNRSGNRTGSRAGDSGKRAGAGAGAGTGKRAGAGAVAGTGTGKRAGAFAGTGAEKRAGAATGAGHRAGVGAITGKRLGTGARAGTGAVTEQRVTPSVSGRSGRNATDRDSRPNRANAPVALMETVEVEIIGIGHDGEGVGRTRDGYTLFVHGALPGERVRVQVQHVKKQYGYARLLTVLQASADRVAAPCPIYEQCGGCQLQHLSYEAQLRWKRQHVVDALERIGKLEVEQVSNEASADSEASGSYGASADTEDFASYEVNAESESHISYEVKANVEASSTQVESVKVENESQSLRVAGVVVHPTIGMSEPWRYRNKAQVPIGQEEGGLIGGFYAQGSHDIIDMEACLIQHEQNDDVVGRVKRIAGELGIRAYDEGSGRGLLRHVVVKVGFRTGDVMVVLVTNGDQIPHADELIGLLRQDVPGLRSIVQNVNTAQTNVIFGDRTKVLWGEEYIHDYIGDIRFAISARSFYQVNPVQTEVLYRKALQYAALSGGETVIDAYCGIGTISLFLAQHAEHVYGVEIVDDAIADARRNAELNGLTAKVTFEAGRAEDVIPAWRRNGIAADVIVVDPPRKGCDASLLETIAAMQPRRIVYVSCNPATLARDLRLLEDAGYRTVEVQPVDMFPHTVHVEAVCSLICKWL